MLEFARPEFLWALPAVGLPVLIHLLSRRSYRRVPWAAMQYLAIAERRTRRRMRWQHVLLLVLRTAAVLLLIMAFARPYLARPLPGLLGDGAGGGRMVLMLDDSASMSQRVGGVSAFERAKSFCLSAAERVADRGTALSVHVANRADAVYSSPRLRRDDLAALEARIEALSTTGAAFRPREALGRIVSEMARATAGFSVYIVTDLRASDWGVSAPDPEARAALESLQEHAAVCVVDVGAEPGETLAVRDLSGVGRLHCTGSAATFQATVHNVGRRKVGPGWLNVRLDGRALPAVAVPPIAPREDRAVLVDIAVDTAGWRALEVALDAGDSFPADDGRALAFEVFDRVPVLIVEGRVSEPNARRSAYYLRTALQPGGAGSACIEVRTRRETDALPDDLSEYRVVFLCDVGDPTPWLPALRAYVESGGRLVAFLGGQADSDAWNASLLDADTGVLACRLSEAVELRPADATHLARLDFSHPVLAPFAGWQALFSAARFTGYWSAEPLGRTEVLAAFRDAGSAAMLHGVLGDGSVFLLCSGADDEWTDWPRSELGRVAYVSLVQWLVEGGRQPSSDRQNLVAGTPLVFPVTPGRFAADATLVGPAESGVQAVTLRAGPMQEGGGLAIATAPLTRAGAWELRLDAADGRPESAYVAVNPPASELDLTRAPREAVLAAATRPGRLSVVRDDERLRTTLRRETRGRGVLSILVVALVAESILAWAFSRGDGSRSKEGSV